MKKKIHPKYTASTITCACGAEFPTRTTTGNYNVEICAQCHPFYTGKTKLVDTAGRIDKFQKKYAKFLKK